MPTAPHLKLPILAVGTFGVCAIILGVVMTNLPHSDAATTTPSVTAPLEMTFAQATDADKNPNKWPLILKTKQKVVQPIRYFPSGIDGVTGWIVKPVGQPLSYESIIYTAQDGHLVILGGLVNTKGENITNMQFKHYADPSAVAKAEKDRSKALNSVATAPSGQTATALPQPAESTASGTTTTPNGITNVALKQKSLAAALKTQPTVVIGHGPAALTIVVDPHCPFCHHYFQSIMATPGIQDDFTLTFMPVGILGFDSVREAALFDGKTNDEKVALLKKVMGGTTVKTQPSGTALGAAMQRTQEWTNAGLHMVPLTIARINDPSTRLSLPGVQNVATLPAIAKASLPKD